jgi:hypothetical protein
MHDNECATVDKIVTIIRRLHFGYAKENVQVYNFVNFVNDDGNQEIVLYLFVTSCVWKGQLRLSF